MNRCFTENSPVQQMVAGSPNWWSIMNNMRPPPLPPPPQQPLSPFLAPPPSSNLFHHYFTPPPLPPPTSSLIPISSSSWNEYFNQELPQSLSQLLLGEQDQGLKQAPNGSIEDHEKQEISSSNYMIRGDENMEYQEPKPTWSQVIPPASSPNSCVSSVSNSMLEFSSNKAEKRHPPPDLPLECNSTATGGALKKARVQPPPTQSTFKVRKEKLGDRITALHQLVSPFGKTDTASVLLESIGYIRFLQRQIEALSLPYLGSGSGNMSQQHSGERNCLFPEDPGQLLNDNCMSRKGACEQDGVDEPKDLRSRGLCLVPISCTLQVESHNGADYWASAFGGGSGGGCFR